MSARRVVGITQGPDGRSYLLVPMSLEQILADESPDSAIEPSEQQQTRP